VRTATRPPGDRGPGSGVRPPIARPAPTLKNVVSGQWSVVRNPIRRPSTREGSGDRGQRLPPPGPPQAGRGGGLGWGVALGTLLLSLVVAATAGAQVTVRAEVSARRVGLDDQVQLSLVVEGRSADLVEDPKLPALDNLRLVGGPSTSTQVSIVNGSISQSRSYIFLLQPIQVGQAQIGPAHIKLSDGERTTAPISIEVVPGSAAPPAGRQADPFADMFGADPFEQMMGRRRVQPVGKIFVEAEVSRRKLYVGEPLLLTYYLYTQSRISGIDFEDAPKYQGFWAEELPRKEDSLRADMATRDGETFQRVAVFKRLLYPTKAGTLSIPPAKLRMGVPRQIGFFPDPGGAGQLVSRATNALEIAVSPLPDDPLFSGAVGSFHVASTIDRSDLGIGDAATLRFRVEGRGNLKWVETAPALAVPGAKVYPPQVKSDLAATEAGITGSRTWEYVIVPETAGRLSLPAQQFAFFDPAAGRIVHTQTAPLALEVRPTAMLAAAPGAAPPATPSGTGGLHLRSEIDLPGVHVPRLGRAAVGALILVALALHGMLLGSRLLGGQLRRGPTGAPRRGLRHALAELRRAGRGGMSKESAALLIERTLVDTFGQVDDRGNGGSEKEAAVREILHEVRFVRYAPQLGDYSEKIREVADRAAAVVRRWA